MKENSSKFYNGIDKSITKELRFQTQKAEGSKLVEKSSLAPDVLIRLNEPQDTLACRIMIVDDKKANLLLLEHILKIAGYTNILCVIDSNEVEESLISFEPDLLILDLVMPGLNGVDILESLNLKKGPLSHIPVLVLTAATGGSIVQAVFEAGANDFLLRPYGKFELLFRVKNLLEARLLNQTLDNYNNVLRSLNRANTQELYKALDESKQNQEETLLMIGSMLEYNDFETKEHIKKLSEIALKLARSLGVEGQDLVDLRWGAYLHDIGKIAIPKSILMKPDKLTAEEYQKIQEHVLIGEEILRELTFIPEKVIEIVKYHHECWDGMGYPHYLSGERIPYLARIFAVADVYNVLISDLPYKKAWTVEEAEKELYRQKHKHFDPDIVDIFLRMNREEATELEMV